MNDLVEFMKAIQNNPETIKLLKETKGTLDLEEGAKVYAEAAKKTGIDVSEKTILELLKVKEEVQRKATEKAQGAVKEALKEQDLDSVAGGGNDLLDPCDDTYTEGEWCWFTDSCSYVISDYGSDNDSPSGDDDPGYNDPDDLLYYVEKELGRCFETPEYI